VTPAASDWFRRSTWSASDQADFFARLKRSRGRKTEYLRLQAAALADTRAPELIHAALQLLDIALGGSPDGFHLSMLHLQRAECLVALGRGPEAVLAFRASLQARRDQPNMINMAYLEFAWTVARLRMTSHYDEVLMALREFGQQSDLVFPTNAFRYFGARALIAADQGDVSTARRCAADAIASAAEHRGPFARHPTFGLVDGAAVDRDAHQRLWRLAAS
jgi:tetratricopeptide (TPR) repeat protein